MSIQKLFGKSVDDIAKMWGKDILVEGDLAVGEAPTGKTFYAGATALKTGTGTKTLNPANETVNAGYYAATTLSAVDADLAIGNIKSGVTIFGFAGTVAAGGTETITKFADATIADNASYTPGASGIFFCGGRGVAYTPQYYSTGDSTWYYVGATVRMSGFTAIGDGTNFRIRNDRGASWEYILFRHYISTGTYERARNEDLVAGATWTPGNSGFFSTGGEGTSIQIEVQYTSAGWAWAGERSNSTFEPSTVVIGDGANLRVKNQSGGPLYHVSMRAKMT